MFNLIIFLFVLGVLVIVHELGHFLAARREGVRVERFSVGFGPVIWSKKKKDTEYVFSAIPLGGYVKLAGDNLEEYKGLSDEYFSKKPGQRALIVFCGPFLNYVLGFLCFWAVFFTGYPSLTAKVGGLVDGFGAQAAGLRINDTITAVDGRKVTDWEELQKFIHAKEPMSVVKLSVLRDGKEQFIDVEIRPQQVNDVFGQKQKVGLLGVTPSYEQLIKVRHGFVESFMLSSQKTYDITVLTLKGLWRMITGKMSMRESVTGPLGIFIITSKVASQGFNALLNFIGLLSISLGIFNLLPLPILDGGHILLLAIEKIRGRIISIKTERIITRIGFVIIMTLILFVTYNDLVKFGSKIIPWLK